MARAKATKRRRLTSANATPSGFKRPVEAIPRPRPHMTFSLNSGNNAEPSRSKTTRRSEFEPRSMTPMRWLAAHGSRSGIRSAHDKPGMPSPQCLAPSGKARIRHEIRMGRKTFFIGRLALIIPGWRQAPTLQTVAQVRDNDFVQHLAVHRRVFNRHQCFDAAIKITRHPIGRADEHLGAIRGQLVAVAEANNTTMLQESTNDALDPNVFGKAWNAWPQTTDAAHHQIDTNPRHRGLVEKVDYGRIDKRVHLRPNLRRLALLCVFDFGFDQLPEPGSQSEGGDGDFLETRGACVARHEIEQTRRVAAQRRIAGEER